MSIEANIAGIENTLRSYPDAKLVIVTKGRSVEDIEKALGALKIEPRIIGENRVQEMERKSPLLRSASKHMIGPLQKNKVRKAIELFDLIQSVDSLALAEKIDTEARAQEKVMPVFLQVNISREAQKHGFFVEELENSFSKIVHMQNLLPSGIMCIPAFYADFLETKKCFQEMKKLYTKIILDFNLKRAKFELSMGMSHDYKIALDAGSTMVRIGRGIFEESNLS